MRNARAGKLQSNVGWIKINLTLKTPCSCQARRTAKILEMRRTPEADRKSDEARCKSANSEQPHPGTLMSKRDIYEHDSSIVDIMFFIIQMYPSLFLFIHTWDLPKRLGLLDASFFQRFLPQEWVVTLCDPYYLLLGLGLRLRLGLGYSIIGFT